MVEKLSEPLEVRVARLEENIKFLVDSAKLDREGRKTHYNAIEKLSLDIQSMSSDMHDVKEKLAGQAPTIEEFIAIKNKVEGAGKLGRWIWVVGAGAIGYVFAMRAAIGAWLMKA